MLPFVHPSLAKDIAWMGSARCLVITPDWEMVDRLFFTEGSGTRRPCQQAEWAARRLCAQCEVRQECLAYALDLKDHVLGMWGGTTEQERDATRAMEPTERRRALNAIFADKVTEVLLPEEYAVA